MKNRGIDVNINIVIEKIDVDGVVLLPTLVLNKDQRLIDIGFLRWGFEIRY